VDVVEAHGAADVVVVDAADVAVDVVVVVPGAVVVVPGAVVDDAPAPAVVDVPAGGVVEVAARLVVVGTGRRLGRGVVVGRRTVVVVVGAGAELDDLGPIQRYSAQVTRKATTSTTVERRTFHPNGS
jgi:hypothetical protein